MPNPYTYHYLKTTTEIVLFFAKGSIPVFLKKMFKKQKHLIKQQRLSKYELSDLESVQVKNSITFLAFVKHVEY